MLTCVNMIKIDTISKSAVLEDEKFKEFANNRMRLTIILLHYLLRNASILAVNFTQVLCYLRIFFSDVHYLPAPTLKSSDKYHDFEDVYGEEPDEKD